MVIKSINNERLTTSDVEFLKILGVSSSNYRLFITQARSSPVGPGRALKFRSPIGPAKAWGSSGRAEPGLRFFGPVDTPGRY